MNKNPEIEFNDAELDANTEAEIMKRLYKHAPLGSYIIIGGYKKLNENGEVEIVTHGVN